MGTALAVSFADNATFQRAMGALKAGNFKDAEHLFKDVLRAQPKHVAALNLLGVVLTQRGKFAEAETYLRLALQEYPKSDATLYNYGIILKALNRPIEALDRFSQALELDPRAVETWNNRGIILNDLKRYDEAIADFDKAIALQPRYAEALCNKGKSLDALNRPTEALAAFESASAFKPDLAEAWLGRAYGYTKLKRYNDALAAFEKASVLKPDLAEAWHGRARVSAALQMHNETVAACDRALALKPNFAEAWVERGDALFWLQRFKESLLAYEKALRLNPNLAEVWRGRAKIFAQFEQHEDACKSADKALSLRPNLDYMASMRLHAKLYMCDWTNFAAEEAQLLSAMRELNVASFPFANLSIASTPADQLEAARRYVSALPRHPSLCDGRAYSHDRIRVAYMSSDLRDHAVGYLTVGLFEHHDKSRFEVTAISLGADRDFDFRRRIRAAFDRIVDIESQSDHEIADRIRELEIDILVDLNGFTRNWRVGVFARRPAPIQVNYLGYAGTLGADCFDYILADSTVIPSGHLDCYSEKPVWLPHTFFVNDAARAVADRTPSRAELNLPDNGFVFCCFNQSYKINPSVFDVWMRLLQAVDGSMLWLRDNDAVSTGNLHLEAERRGVAPERLIFAPRAPLVAEHLARLRQADLFLDTLPYNAHTTAADALWVGVPVVTRIGSTFAGRVAASLLRAVGLPELVTELVQDYEALALKIAREPELLASFKAKLAQNCGTFPLFNTARFARNVEAAYTAMWQRHKRGEPPTHFAVKVDE